MYDQKPNIQHMQTGDPQDKPVTETQMAFVCFMQMMFKHFIFNLKFTLIKNQSIICNYYTHSHEFSAWKASQDNVCILIYQLPIHVQTTGRSSTPNMHIHVQCQLSYSEYMCTDVLYVHSKRVDIGLKDLEDCFHSSQSINTLRVVLDDIHIQ